MHKKPKHYGLVIVALINMYPLLIVLASSIHLGWLMLTDHRGDLMPGDTSGLERLGWETSGQEDMNNIMLGGWILIPCILITTFFYRRYIKANPAGKTHLLIKSILIANFTALLCILIVAFIIEPIHWR